MSFLRLQLAAGLLVAGVAGFSAVTGWRPAARPASEAIPPSVRENPASYRPAVVFYGWRPPRTTTGGGYRSGK